MTDFHLSPQISPRRRPASAPSNIGTNSRIFRASSIALSDAPGDREELIRILWSHARSKDKAHSIKASAELNRIMEVTDREKEAELANNVEATLDTIAEISPDVALHLATKHNIQWRPGLNISDQVAASRRQIAMAYWAEQQAQKEASA